MGDFTAFKGTSEFKLVYNGFDELSDRCKEAAFNSVDDMRRLAEPRAKLLAPKRSGGLARSISSWMRSRTEAVVSADKSYALAQEKGASPHAITGFLKFFWVKRGRMFIWNNPEYDNWNPVTGATVNHPGNPAHPYIRPALTHAISRWRTILPKNYRV